jgi:hypothetical protein
MAGLAVFDRKKINRRNHAHRSRLKILYYRQTQKKWAPESPARRS